VLGYNDPGQLGDGTWTDSTTPVQASGLTDIIAIAAGSTHTVALKSDGTVWTWGGNFYGELGEGTVPNLISTPVCVTTIHNVISIASGFHHTIAVKSDGTVWVWGSNEYGQIGDGSFIDRWSPVQAAGATDVVAVSAGYRHTTALKSDGSILAWGDNGAGQLGIGSPYAVGQVVDSGGQGNFNLTCTYSLSENSAFFEYGFGTGSVFVNTSDNSCTWDCVSNDAWITIPSGTNYIGSNTVTYEVSANPDVFPRAGTITIAGEVFNVEQSGLGSVDAWSDYFNDGPDQTWNLLDYGDNSTALFVNDRYELHTENTGLSTDKSISCYVEGYVTDAMIQSRIQEINAGDIFLAGVLLRNDPVTLNGYGAFISPSRTLYIGKGGIGGGVLCSATYAFGSVDPKDCQIKFAAIGDKLYSKAWSTGSPEPSSWKLETTDSDFEFGYGGIYLSTGGSGLYFSPSQAAFDDVVLTTDVCSYFISPTSNSFDENGGSDEISVNADNNFCQWTAVSHDPEWLVIDSGSSGTGNDTVNYTVAANTTCSERTGTITIAGETFTVNQDAESCVYSIDLISKQFDSAGGNGSVSVTTSLNCCDWTATTTYDWIHPSGSGPGDGIVNYTVDANPDPGSRFGTLIIAGETFTVYQAGNGGVTEWSDNFDGGPQETWVSLDWSGVNPSAEFVNDRYEFSLEGAGGIVHSAVFGNVATDCVFKGRIQAIPPDNQFIVAVTIRGDVAQGTAYMVSITNTSGAISIGKIKAGFPFTELSSGTLEIDLDDFWLKFAAIGSDLYVRVWGYGEPEPATWNLNASDSDYNLGGCSIMLQSGGFASASVAFDEVSFTTDLSSTCSCNISPELSQFDTGYGFGSININTVFDYCEWSPLTADSWITNISGGGPGNGTVTYEVTPNTSQSPRTGVISIDDQDHKVYQCGTGGVDLFFDDFNGSDPPNQQTWYNIDNGINSSALFVNSQYEISTENDASSPDEYFDSYVAEAASDAIIKANIKQIDGGDNYFAGLSLRFDPETDSGYGVTIISGGYAVIGKRTNGVGEALSTAIEIGASVAIDCQVKFAAVGTNLYAKIWETGADEPKEWQLEATDPDYSIGFAGVKLQTALTPDVFLTSARVAFDDVSLTTDLANNLCAYSFSPISTTSGELGGSYSVNVISYPDCPVCQWTAEPQDGWLTTSSSGYGFGTVDYDIEDNLTGADRTGHISINSGLETFEILQYGGALWTETFDNNTLHNSWVFIDTFEPGDVYNNPPILSNDGCRFDVESTDGPEDKHLSGYVNDVDREDAIIQASFNAIDSDDIFLAGLGLRYDPITDSGYGFGITNWGHIWFNKRINGISTPLVVKLLNEWSLFYTYQTEKFNPEFCNLKFAVVGNKLFGKVWTTGTVEPADWQLEFTDYSFTTGKGGIGVGTWPTGYEGVFEHSRGVFDNVRYYDTSSFWTSSSVSTGQEISADDNVTLTVGDSEVLVDSNSGENSIISIAETDDGTYRYTNGIFGSTWLKKQIKISSDLEDGQHRTVVKMHYTDEEIPDARDEASLRLTYYNDVSRSWRLAVSGNTSPPIDPQETFRLSAPPDIASAVLGDHGVDTGNNILWAVVDHYSEYSAIEAEAGGWALFNNGIMYFGEDNKQENTLAINAGGSYVWVSDTPATSQIVYSDASWTGQLNFEEIAYGGDEFTVEVGYSVDGNTFVAGTISATIVGDESGMERAYDIDTGADGELTLSAGQYVALRVTNNSAKDFHLRTGGLRSWLNSASQVSSGDINGDGKLDLSDAILVLKITVGISPGQDIFKIADVNGDNKIGIEDLIYILEAVSGMRQ
jgi:hypothetical protein